MRKKIEQVTDGELGILRVLWERGEATSREITQALYAEVTDPKMATVQKLVERLESKGCVARNRTERAHRFRARVSQDEFLRSRLQSLADRVCDGELASLMTTLVRSKGISRVDRDQLRKLIEDLWPSKPARS
jgi:BlaI family transcriptional regulator, penicillinase repressor